jgi:WD40 repeat protein
MPVGCATVALVMTWIATAAPAQNAAPAETVNFDRDVHAILRKRCAGCHNAERPRGELDMTSYAGVVAGGSSGKAAVAGNPEESPLYTFASHLEEPHMPPNAPRIPQRELDVIRRWIEGGLREKPGETVAPPSGAAAMAPPSLPAGGLVAPRVTPAAPAVTALAVHPSDPVVAISGHKQVVLVDISARALLGALTFPEGDIFALRFSRDGRLLLAAGGLGAESGKAVVFETKSWRRTAALGDELDVVLAADLSPDSSKVVLGGPGRVVKVLTLPEGAAVNRFNKPTDWVTAAGFSPDGLLAAAGDRFGGLFLWETRSGREFLTLRGHVKAVNGMAWDESTDRLITCGDDGKVQVWDLHTGKAAAGWNAHDGGTLGVALDHSSGRIASGGRDRRVKVWSRESKLLADLGPTTDQSTRVAWTSDAHSVISGDAGGEVRLWKLEDASSIRLPMPVVEKPVAIALVVPVMTPARPFVPKTTAPPPSNSPGERGRARNAPPDDLDAALASAREAAAAALKSVAKLSQLAESRGRSPAEARSDGAISRRSVDARIAARSALSSLRAAMEAAPGNAALARAIEETERAVRLLEAGTGPPAAPSEPSAAD